MPTLVRGRRRVRYELDGPADAPAFVLVNGLTQYIELWEPYRFMLVQKGFRVATFDLLGQGVSDKPTLRITQDDQVAVLHSALSRENTHPSGWERSSEAGSILPPTEAVNVKEFAYGWCQFPRTFRGSGLIF